MKRILKKILRLFFEIGQRLGFDFLPRHFYSNIPDIGSLKRVKGWRKPMSMVGIEGTNLDEQIAFLSSCCTVEVVKTISEGKVYEMACQQNASLGYGPIEAEVLFAFILKYLPKKVIQIGCGVSTSVMLQAYEAANQDYEMICIEPFPSEYLQTLASKGRIQLIEKRAQDVEESVLTDLGPSDFLFVDSTHTVKVDSEVNRLIFEILPRLLPETYVHFHDIYFPYDYSRNVLSSELFFGVESSLLQAFLIHNNHFKILMSLSMLHYGKPLQLKERLPSYQPDANEDGLGFGDGHFPSSIYLKVQK